MSMVQTNDVPGSVRIRTGEGNEWRFDAIKRAAEYYNCNRSDAVAYASEDVVELVEAVRQILEREDLTLEQRREIAEIFSTRAVAFEIHSKLEMEFNP